jgi:transposase-like protein
LAKKYGISHTLVYKWLKAIKSPNQKKSRWKKPVAESFPALPVEVEQLQSELKKEQLRNKLLNALLDIGKEQYGIDLRKKTGTKRS